MLGEFARNLGSAKGIDFSYNDKETMPLDDGKPIFLSKLSQRKLS